MSAAPSRPSVGFAIVLAILVAAPTVGDVGGCNDSAEPLDARKFFAARLQLTCERCGACGHATATCKRACDGWTPVPSSFPAGCAPIVHDGQVCLRALEALSCDAFGDFVGSPAVTPTECDFCPERLGGGGP